MKLLTYLVVLIAATGVGFAARNAMSRPAEAARAPAERSAVVLASGTRDDAGGELVFARIAADCGSHLLDKARRASDDERLLRLAVGHLRACLAHEAGADPLFADARRKLEQAEALLKRPEKPAPKPAAPAAPAPAPVKAPEPPKPAEEAPLMAGPDGTPIRRAD